jgi:hypothetical protein
MLPPVEAEERRLRLEWSSTPALRGTSCDTDRGLSSAVITADRERGMRSARHTQAGMTHVPAQSICELDTTTEQALSALSVERGFALEDVDGTLTHLGELWTDDQVRMNNEGCDPDGRFYGGSRRTTSGSAPARCTGSISTAPCAWCWRTSCTGCQPILFVRAYAAALPSSSPLIMYRPPALAGHPFLRFP